MTDTLGLDLMYQQGVDLLMWQAGDFDELATLIEMTESRPVGELDQIRKHGRDTVWNRDTYRHRAKEILDIVGIER